MKTKLICYLSLGYPSLEKSIDIASTYIKGGCDVIEIGWPTDNPYIDGEAVAERMKKSLEFCSDYEKYYQTIKKIRTLHPNNEFINLIYEHTLLKIGVEKFIFYCKDLKIDSVILVGPKDDKVKNILMENNIKVSCYIEFHLPEEQIKEAINSNGFVYLQAKSVGKVREGVDTLEKCISYLRMRGIKNPIYCGVGVSTKEDVALIARSKGEGAFIGSVILKRENNLLELEEFIKDLKEGTL